MAEQNAQHVVIVGAGFGGLNLVKDLAQAPVRITLLDRHNFHLFQALLYQVATGALSPANIASPLRGILKRQKNVEVLLAEVIDIDVNNRRVILSDGAVGYDMLVVATGVRHNYFGHPEWEAFAPGLKNIEDATEIRRRILLSFEAAERETDPEKIREWLTFIVVGAGPTGVELAGALGEIAHYTLRNNFRHIDPAQARILLVEGVDRVLSSYPTDLSAAAQKALNQLGVTVRTGTMVVDIQADSVTLRHGDQVEQVATHTILWAAGVEASPLGKTLADATGATIDRAGRISVAPDLTLPGHPEIFVIGDLAVFTHQTGQPLPGVALVAIQQGRYIAHLIKTGSMNQPHPPFHYRDLGNMAAIGRAAAVADLHAIHLTGFIGWSAWLFIHLIRLIQFENRLLVLLQWAWNYFTRDRSTRLITGPSPLPLTQVNERREAEEAQVERS